MLIRSLATAILLLGASAVHARDLANRKFKRLFDRPRLYRWPDRRVNRAVFGENSPLAMTI